MTTTRLRAPRPEEHPLLEAWHAEPSSPYDDFSGLLPSGLEHCTRLPPPPGGGELVVTDVQDVLLGTVSWRPVTWGPSPGSQAFDVGISLRPSGRGRGHGGRAQRLLADYLFTTTHVHRVQASTDVDNAPEQAALRRAGFSFEGVVRQAQWRSGAFHDLQLWARLRTDA